MRFTWAAISLLCSVGSVAAQQVAPVSDIDLPYSACGDMAALRTNLTGTPDPSPKSDAILRQTRRSLRRPCGRAAGSPTLLSERRMRTDHRIKRRPPGGGRRRQFSAGSPRSPARSGTN